MSIFSEVIYPKCEPKHPTQHFCSIAMIHFGNQCHSSYKEKELVVKTNEIIRIKKKNQTYVTQAELLKVLECFDMCELIEEWHGGVVVVLSHTVKALM